MTTEIESATVLVVEDEQSLADLFTQFLKPTYTVHTAYGGAEALEIMSHDVDVVLLDRRMPGRSGEEVLRAFREEGYECRIAMVTAVTPDFDIIEMGFDDYLTKPIDRSELLETVEQLLELDAYDDLVQEYYGLASKKAALEVEKPDIDLSNHDEFDRLTDRLDEVEAELEAKQGTASGFDLRTLLE